MKNTGKIVVVVALALAVAATFALRSEKRAVDARREPAAAGAPGAARRSAAPLQVPRLVEVGSSRCQACQQMALVLEELRASQGAKLSVEFVDVFERPEAMDTYKVSLIPTQVLYDAAGREIYRHTGYFSHDDILKKFRSLGVSL